MRGKRAADEDERGALDPRRATCAAMSPSVPRKMRCAGVLACTTTAAGQSAP